MDVGYIISGLLVGLLVGITGVGGGSLMTPLLVFLFGFNPKVAVGTDLLFAAITKTGGVAVHHGNHKSVEWSIVGWLALGSLPAACLTIYTLRHLAASGKEISHVMTFTLGIALILTALSIIIKNYLQKSVPTSVHHREGERFGRYQNAATITLGVILGVLVTLTSVGAGALGTVALIFLYPRLATVKIVGTDLAHAIPLTAIGGLGHLSMGNVNFALLGSLLIGSLPGIWAGSHLSAKIPEKYLRPLLATMLMLIGFKFVL